MPHITDVDQDARDDGASRWVITALIAVQCIFLMTCLAIL
jgi:hypothetical protein